MGFAARSASAPRESRTLAGRWSFAIRVAFAEIYPELPPLILFPLYAVLVWYACYRWRRHFLGVAALAAGVLGVAFLAWLDVVLTRLISNRFPSMLFLLLLGAEAGVLIPVGIFVWLVPRERAAMPCGGCGYELKGLEAETPKCPECGKEGQVEADGPILSDPGRTARVYGMSGRAKDGRAIGASPTPLLPRQGAG